MQRRLIAVLVAALVVAAPAAGRTVTAAPPVTDHNPVFSPGGKTIAFIRWDHFATHGRVMLMRRDGRGLRALTPEQQVPWGITWSPDGRSLAYTSRGDIWRVDVSTGTLVNLTNDPTDESWQPAWSPDGKWIAYDRFESCWRCSYLHLVSPDGTQDVEVADGSNESRRPSWAPDASSLVLSLNELRIVDLHGNVLAQSPDGGAYATFSPDGKQVVHTLGRALMIFDPATQVDTRISTAIHAVPMWSRDGRLIAGAGFRGRLVIVTAAGAPVATIAAANVSNSPPSWGADGRIAYVHAGTCGIDIAHADGTDVHRLTRVC